MFCAPSSGLWVPGLAGGVPMGMRHAASGIGLWPGAAATHAARSSDIEINRLIRKSGDLLPGAAIIIHSAFSAAQNSAAASPRVAVPAWPCLALPGHGARRRFRRGILGASPPRRFSSRLRRFSPCWAFCLEPPRRGVLSCGETAIDDLVQALVFRRLAGSDRQLRPSARPPSARRLSQPYALVH